jgi:uncharacterized protein YidB (DUF937 family)
MARGMPSLAALLGLLAVAGYQNRDKLKDLLGGTGQEGRNPSGQSGQAGGLGGILGGLGGLLGGANPDTMVNGGLTDLVERFRQNGHGSTADAWVSKGPNPPLPPNELERAVGSDVVETLVERTGLTREELLSRLSQTLPEAVDKYTPDGRIPS